MCSEAMAFVRLPDMARRELLHNMLLRKKEQRYQNINACQIWTLKRNMTLGQVIVIAFADDHILYTFSLPFGEVVDALCFCFVWFHYTGWWGHSRRKLLYLSKKRQSKKFKSWIRWVNHYQEVLVAQVQATAIVDDLPKLVPILPKQLKQEISFDNFHLALPLGTAVWIFARCLVDTSAGLLSLLLRQHRIKVIMSHNCLDN